MPAHPRSSQIIKAHFQPRERETSCWLRSRIGNRVCFHIEARIVSQRAQNKQGVLGLEADRAPDDKASGDRFEMR